MTDAEIVVGVRGEISQGKVVKRTLDDIANSGDRAKGASDALERSMRGVNSAANNLRSALAGLVAGLGLREVVRMVDSYNLLQERMKQATRSTAEFQQALSGLQRVSNETGSSLKDAVDVFQRLSFVRDELNATVDDMVTFTGTVQKLGVISGASTSEMSNGLRQLAQAMSAGVVRAEEWNSVMENTPVIAKRVADQLGVTTGELRRLVVEGLVASEDLFNAVLNSAADVERAYAEMPMTIGRAFSQLYNEMQVFVGQTADASGATKGMIAVIDGLRLAVNGLKTGFEAITTIIGTVFNALNVATLNAVNFITDKVNWLITQVNRLPGMDISLIEKRQVDGDIPSIMREGIDALKQDMATGVASNPRTVFDPAEPLNASQRQNAQRQITKDYAKLAAGLKDTDEKTTEIDRKLKSLVNSTRTWQEEIAELERLRPFAKTQEQLTAIDRAIDKIRRDVEKNSPTYKAFESFAKGIDDGFRDAFRNAFTQSEGGFKGMLEGLKSSFKTFLADLAYMAIARPIMLNIVAGIGGSLGLSSGGISDILGGSGTNMLGGIGNLFSAGRSLLSGGNLFGVNSTLGLRVNQLGGLLGIDNLSSLSSFTNGSFGGTLGAGIAGFAGNALGNLVFGGDRGIGSSIGGTLGAIAGSFIPVPIVGPLVGSFLGNAIGGLFGGKSVPSGYVSAAINAKDGKFYEGHFTSDEATQEQTDAYKSLQNSAVTGLNNVLSMMGATLEVAPELRFSTSSKRDGGKIRVGVEGVHTLGYGINDMLTQASFTDGEKAIEYAILTVLQKATFKGIDAEMQMFFKKAFDSSSTVEQAIKDIQLIQNVLQDIKTPAEQSADAITKINDEFDALRARAIELGLPFEKIEETLEKQRAAAIGMVKAMEAGFQSMEAMKATFDSWLYDQSMGDSSLSPMGKLETAQGKFGDLLTKAQGGDLSVTQDLLKAANDLLSMGRSVYASSVSFAGLESFVRSSITEIARAAGVPGYASGADAVAGGLSMVGEQGPELRRLGRGDRVWSAGETASIMALSGNVASDLARSNAQMIALSSQMLEETREMRKELRQMRKQSERSANRKAVAGA